MQAKVGTHIKEDFLHYLWKLKQFDMNQLFSTQGERLQIYSCGEHNHQDGPDFLNGRVKIGDTLWAGNIEIHVKASEWTDHKHHLDKSYDNVVLHVVLEENKTIRRPNGERIPCLELKNRIPKNLYLQYLKLNSNSYTIPCLMEYKKVNEITRNIWLDRLLVERLEKKTAYIERLWKSNRKDWELTFYQMLARNFGVKSNMDAFECLARNLHLNILKKNKDSLFKIEALLFGQAGLLEKEFIDDYPGRLKKEYQFLQKKYQLKSQLRQSWKFMRMRPANFPTIRIAQFATLVYQSEHLLSKILSVNNVQEIENTFNVKLSNYWQDHYVFEKPSIHRQKKLGKSTIHLFIINTIVPFMFFYGKMIGEEVFQKKALYLLEELKPEKNKVIDFWKKIGQKADTAYQSQGLLQLKTAYCDHKRCMECAVGCAIMMSSQKSFFSNTQLD